MRAMHVLLVCALAISTVAAYRLPRDVSELDASKAPQAKATAADDGTTLTQQGYAYRTVRQLRYRLRQRRDVSHLNREYLPPIPTPSREFLPPNLESSIYAAPIAAKLSNEYLPPAEPANEPESSTLAASLDTTTPLPVSSEEVTTASTITTTTTSSSSSSIATTTEPEQDTAVLLDDGYHYKRPAVTPDLGQLPAEPLPLEPEVFTLNSEQPGAPFEQDELADGPIENEMQPVPEYLPPDTAATADEEPTAEEEPAVEEEPEAEIEPAVEEAPAAEPTPTDAEDPRLNEITPELEYLPPAEQAVSAQQQITAESVTPNAREYLPPLEEGVVIAEGPAEDTAVLDEDGYHYRAIKRIRF